MSGRICGLVYGKVLGAPVRKAVMAYCAERAAAAARRREGRV